jgi:hypothetical protein
VHVTKKRKYDNAKRVVRAAEARAAPATPEKAPQSLSFSDTHAWG